MFIMKIIIYAIFALALLILAVAYYIGSNAPMDSDAGNQAMIYFSVSMVLLMADAGLAAITLFYWLYHAFFTHTM